MSHRTRCRSGAFTLIEMMIAVAIFSMVITAIYSTWTAVLHGARVGRDAAERVQRTRVAMEVIERALASARLFQANVAWYAFEVDNSGEFPALSFVAHLPQAFPRSGRFGALTVRRVTFTVEAAKGGGNELVLRQNPILMDLDQDEKDNPVVLATNLSFFGLDFWDAGKGDWVQDWPNEGILPPLVRVSLGFPNPSEPFSKTGRVYTRVVAIPGQAVPRGLQVPAVRRGPPTARPGAAIGGPNGAVPGTLGSPGIPNSAILQNPGTTGPPGQTR